MSLIQLTIITMAQALRPDDASRVIRYPPSDYLKFEVNPADLGSSACYAQGRRENAEHFFMDTCPLDYDPLCQDPLFNKNQDFEFRCRFPFRTNSVLTMNSAGFLEMLRMRDPYARDWCMIVLFHSPSCPFSARLAPHFNEIPRKFQNILPVAVDASDFSKSHRLNFRYGVSGTPTVLLWVNGMGVARMGNKDLDYNAIKELITSHTDLTEIPEVEQEEEHKEQQENIIPKKILELGAELRDVSIEMTETKIWNAIQMTICILICAITIIYHIRERILLCPPVLAWFQSKCGGPLCEDIYFLFYVVAPRYRAPPSPPPRAQEPDVPDAPEAEEENPDDVVELPELVIPAEEEQEVQL